MTASGFSYGDYYRAVTVLERLLRGPDEERSWLLAMPRERRPTEHLLYLGCNILKTVHLAQAAIRILDALGVDHVAVGGPAFCCGIVQRNKGDQDVSTRMFGRTMTLFDAFAPKTLINWCPSCERQQDHMEPDHSRLPYRVEHYTGFLARHLAGRRFARSVPLRVAVHVHGGDPRTERDHADVQAILRMIPGLEFTLLPMRPELDYHCSSTGPISSRGRDWYNAIVDSDVAQAKREGAAAIMSVYHSCHRELSKRIGRTPDHPPILNYTTLVATALGLALPEDRYAKCAALAGRGGLGAVIAELLPYAEELGLKRETVEAVVRSEFAGAAA